MSQHKPMFPDKARMVRSANILWLIFTIAPVLYLSIAIVVTFGRTGLAREQSIVLPLFFALAIVSAANIGLIIFFQTSKTVFRFSAQHDPVGRIFLIWWTGAILSEALAIYGFILALLSGSIFYEVGFTLFAWGSLLWVRGRFKQNLAKLPDP